MSRSGVSRSRRRPTTSVGCFAAGISSGSGSRLVEMPGHGLASAHATCHYDTHRTLNASQSSGTPAAAASNK